MTFAHPKLKRNSAAPVSALRESRRVYDVAELAAREPVDMDELAAVVARKAAPAVVQALVECGYVGVVEVRPAPLLTYVTLGEALGGASKSLIHSWLREGCPHVRVGDSPRFALDQVVDWLRTRAEKAGEP